MSNEYADHIEGDLSARQRFKSCIFSISIGQPSQKLDLFNFVSSAEHFSRFQVPKELEVRSFYIKLKTEFIKYSFSCQNQELKICKVGGKICGLNCQRPLYRNRHPTESPLAYNLMWSR